MSKWEYMWELGKQSGSLYLPVRCSLIVCSKRENCCLWSNSVCLWNLHFVDVRGDRMWLETYQVGSPESGFWSWLIFDKEVNLHVLVFCRSVAVCLSHIDHFWHQGLLAKAGLCWLPAGSVRSRWGSLDSPAVPLCVVNLSNWAPWGMENCLQSPRETCGWRAAGSVPSFIPYNSLVQAGKGRTVLCLVAQSCLTLCNPMDCNPHQAPLSMEILQARMLEWVAISSSRGSSWPRDRTQVSLIAGRFFTIWATREAQEYWSG